MKILLIETPKSQHQGGEKKKLLELEDNVGHEYIEAKNP